MPPNGLRPAALLQSGHPAPVPVQRESWQPAQPKPGIKDNDCGQTDGMGGYGDCTETGHNRGNELSPCMIICPLPPERLS